MFQVRDFLNVWTRESISLILREEYPSAHPNAHFNLLQGINNKLRLMFYNLFYPQSKVEGKLQLKGKWDIRDRVTRQKHPPPQTACWILESVLHVLVLCESLHLHHHFICWYTLHCLLLLKYAISILSVRFLKPNHLLWTETCQVELEKSLAFIVYYFLSSLMGALSQFASLAAQFYLAAGCYLKTGCVQPLCGRIKRLFLLPILITAWLECDAFISSWNAIPFGLRAA